MTVSGKKIAQRLLPGRAGSNKSSSADGYAACGDLLDRQRDRNAGAMLQAGFDADGATMRFNDATDDGETNAGTLGFGGTEHGGEGALLQFLAHALARILEFHRDVRECFARTWQPNSMRFDHERAPLGHRFGRVENQV